MCQLTLRSLGLCIDWLRHLDVYSLNKLDEQFKQTVPLLCPLASLVSNWDPLSCSILSDSTMDNERAASEDTVKVTVETDLCRTQCYHLCHLPVPLHIICALNTNFIVFLILSALLLLDSSLHSSLLQA